MDGICGTKATYLKKKVIRGSRLTVGDRCGAERALRSAGIIEILGKTIENEDVGGALAAERKQISLIFGERQSVSQEGL